MVKFFKAAALASLFALTHADDQNDFKLDQKGQIQVGNAKCLNDKFAEVDCSERKTTFHLVHGMLCDEKDVKCLQPTKGRKYKLAKLGNEIEGSISINNDSGFIEHKINEIIKCITVTEGKIHSTECTDGNIRVPDASTGAWKTGDKCLSSKNVDKDKTLPIKAASCRDKFCEDKHCSWKLENGIMKTTDGKRCVIDSNGVLKSVLCTSATPEPKFADDEGTMHPLDDSEQCLIRRGKRVVFGPCATTKFEWVPETVATTAEPTTAEPTTVEPTTVEPTTAEPTTAEPTTAEPTTAEPTTAEPTTAEPTTAEPTTAEPTTAEPTTAEPTTAEPTTAEPTTAEPSTAEPTTAEPSTAEPSTAEPTTAEPTTAEPTTAKPTLPPRNVEKNKIHTKIVFPVRWSLSFTITPLGIGNRAVRRNIVHVNKTAKKSLAGQKWYHAFPNVSFEQNTDYDLVIITSDCNSSRAGSVYKTGWATGEKHIVTLKSRNVANSAKPFVDKTYIDLWIDNKLVATYTNHKSCHNSWEHAVVYTSNNFDESANASLSSVSYAANGHQPNNYPWNVVKTVKQWKKNYRLKFICRVMGRTTPGWASLVYVGAQKERMPAVFWKTGTRFTMTTSHVKNNAHWRALEHSAGVKNGDVFHYEFVCTAGKKATVKMRWHGGNWVLKKSGTCDFGYTNGRALKVYASSPWSPPADVQISGVEYTYW